MQASNPKTTAAILKDIVDGKDLRVGAEKNLILVATDSGAVPLKVLAALAARPGGVPAFRTSQVPESVKLTLTVGVGVKVAEDGDRFTLDAVLNFMSDDELTPTIPNPSVTVITHGGLTVGHDDVKTTVNWREPDDPVEPADAIEQLARSYGWNPEGAAAMGFTEVTLIDWLRKHVAPAGLAQDADNAALRRAASPVDPDVDNWW